MMPIYFKTITNFLHRYQWYIWVGCISLLFSLGAYFNGQPVNPDAVDQYLPAAANFLSGHFHDALVYARFWPLYALGIAGVSKFFSISLLSAALSINAIVNVLLVWFFIACVRELAGEYYSKALAVFSAVIILSFHSYNVLRGDVIRDFGYWAFLLLSLIYYIRFLRFGRFKHAIAWALWLIVATLFRIEGAVLFYLMPWLLFFQPDKTLRDRGHDFLKLFGVTFFVSLVMFVVVLTQHHISVLGRFQDFLYQLQHAGALVKKHFHHKATQQTHNYLLWFPYLGHWLARFGLDFLDTLGVIYFLLMGYGWYASRKMIFPSVRRLLFLLILFYFVLLLVFDAQGWPMSGRYFMGICFILLLGAPFGLLALYNSLYYDSARSAVKRILFYILLCILFVEGVSGVFHFFGTRKGYIVKAGEFVYQSVPQTKTLYTNNHELMLYAHRLPWMTTTYSDHGFSLAQFKQKWKQFDYFVLQEKKNSLSKEGEFLKRKRMHIVQVFENRSGDKIIIYRK